MKLNLKIISITKRVDPYKSALDDSSLNLNGDRLIDVILDYEGVPRYKALNALEIMDTTIQLFNYQFNPLDPRGRLAFYYKDILEVDNKGRIFENALIAKYLSSYPSIRMNYGKLSTEWAIRQYARAFKNIELGAQIKIPIESISDFQIRFTQTDRINKGVNTHQVTGCPEALWQYQLFEKKQYLGRIGFNLHEELGSVIVSIVNIQGAKGQKNKLVLAEKKLGNKFGVILINRLREKLTSIFKSQNLILRGGYFIRADVKPDALYHSTFRKTAVPMYKTTNELK
ncbi:MAG: hypothetical protein A2Y40_08280 [Candidatus Margulisbacteria bacterium GWF2_35_9]|nr:MAG: hypothetical protein A2Y40_08280 [Candidatus Margulisbacteria bacterium GWF2_35_9]